LYKRIWINPPFTRKHEFIVKAWNTWIQARNDIYILFPIEFVTTARFHNSVGGGINQAKLDILDEGEIRHVIVIPEENIIDF